jgi:hypothetical protein
MCPSCDNEPQLLPDFNRDKVFSEQRTSSSSSRNYFPSQGRVWEGRTLSNADLVWTSEVKRGRTEFTNIANLGREPNEGFAAMIAPKIDPDRHLSARRPVLSLGIVAPTVCRYLTEVLGMKCRQLCWTPLP